MTSKLQLVHDIERVVVLGFGYRSRPWEVTWAKYGHDGPRVKF